MNKAIKTHKGRLKQRILSDMFQKERAANHQTLSMNTQSCTSFTWKYLMFLCVFISYSNPAHQSSCVDRVDLDLLIHIRLLLLLFLIKNFFNLPNFKVNTVKVK